MKQDELIIERSIPKQQEQQHSKGDRNVEAVSAYRFLWWGLGQGKKHCWHYARDSHCSGLNISGEISMCYDVDTPAIEGVSSDPQVSSL